MLIATISAPASRSTVISSNKSASAPTRTLTAPSARPVLGSLQIGQLARRLPWGWSNIVGLQWSMFRSAQSRELNPSRPIRVAVVGATGYAGGELVGLLARHPLVELRGLVGP